MFKHPMRSHWIALAMLACSSVAPLAAVADTIHLYNGIVVDDCKVKSMVGELIYYKGKRGKETQVNRMEINGHTDVIRIWGRHNPILEGLVMYLDPYRVEVKSKEGRVKLPRWRVREITLGRPKNMAAPAQVILTDQDARMDDGGVPGGNQFNTAPASQETWTPSSSTQDTAPDSGGAVNYLQLESPPDSQQLNYDPDLRPSMNPQPIAAPPPSTYQSHQHQSAYGMPMVVSPRTSEMDPVDKDTASMGNTPTEVSISREYPYGREGKAGMGDSDHGATNASHMPSNAEGNPSEGDEDMAVRASGKGEKLDKKTVKQSRKETTDDEMKPIEPPWYNPLHPVDNRLP